MKLAAKRRASEPGTSNTGIQPFQSTIFLDKLQTIGFRILLLGISPEKYMNGPSIQRVLLFMAMLIFFTISGFVEATKAVMSRNMLEMISHAYITTFIITFHWEWLFMLMIMKSWHATEIHIEKFNCTRSVPDAAKRYLDNNVKFLVRILICSTLLWASNNMTHSLGPAFEALIAYVKTGAFIGIFIFPPIFDQPRWVEIIIYLSNFMTMTIILLCVIGSYTVMSIRILKIKTLCETLNEALRNDPSECTKIRDYIEDHVELIKITKTLSSHLANLNGVMFFSCYLEIAEQLFAVTLFEPNGTFYLAIFMDMLSMLTILSYQCFMGSMITESLESVAFGVYESPWYTRDKRASQEVIIMTQAAQRKYIQTAWFGSLKVERATILKICQNSYAFFSLLVIIQNRNEQ